MLSVPCEGRKGERKMKTRVIRKLLVSVTGLCIAGVLMFFMHTFYKLAIPSGQEFRISAIMFAVLAFGIAWGIRSLWVSALDEAVNDMGPIALQTYISKCQEVWQKKYGHEKEEA